MPSGNRSTALRKTFYWSSQGYGTRGWALAQKKMNKNDLDKIEKELEIKLPESYRLVMENDLPTALKGNSNFDLWDNPDVLIKRNIELRKGDSGFKQWPNKLFFIGDPLTACGNAIDLSSQDSPVWWVDHCDLDGKGSGEISPSFKNWVETYLTDIRNDLENSDIAPDTPMDSQDVNTGCLGFIILGLLITIYLL